jgi:hypothetical protein
MMVFLHQDASVPMPTQIQEIEEKKSVEQTATFKRTSNMDGATIRHLTTDATNRRTADDNEQRVCMPTLSNQLRCYHVPPDGQSTRMRTYKSSRRAQRSVGATATADQCLWQAAELEVM